MKWTRTIPILGWLFLMWGAWAAAQGRLPRSHAVRAALMIDAGLSIGAHAVQIPAAISAAQPLGHSRRRITLLTMVFGATWYRTLA
ncbi:hypothetical protein [Rhodococcus sovatensis]|uniref:Uncharacterized protein n=1 Tax=Rhodococcus sovatensis TaxID=1805840 RepID=A0ABZ2PNQ5_9NOCA